MSRNNRKNEVRVNNPFGAPSAEPPGPSPFGSFGQGNSIGFGAINQSTGTGNLFAASSVASSFATQSGSPGGSTFGSFGQPAIGLAGGSTFGSFGQPAVTPVTSTFGSFGQPAVATGGSAFGAFGQPASSPGGSTFGSFGQVPSGGTSTFGAFSQPANSVPSSQSMHGDEAASPKTRATNPFAAIAGGAALTMTEAIHQYKSEFRKKKGYPFSCFGAADTAPVFPGDISPYELRWHLENPTLSGSQEVIQMISQRSEQLNEDFTQYLRAAFPPGTIPTIERTGPYNIPTPDYPSFVPRNPFHVVPQETSSLTEEELSLFKNKGIHGNIRIPLIPPPLEFRSRNNFFPPIMATWKLLDLQDKWNNLNDALNVMGDSVSIKAMEIPGITNASSDEDFRVLLGSMKALKHETVELGKQIRNQSEVLEVEMKHFYELARDYESEVDIYRKGRDQAFQLYDNLSEQQKSLLSEYEMLKAECKFSNEKAVTQTAALSEAEDLLRSGQEATGQLVEELSSLKVELFGLKKKLELVEEDNERFSQLKLNESHDRNDLIEQLSKEVKSRNDALVLAEAARNELSRLLGQSEEDRLAKEKAEHERDEAIGSVDVLHEQIQELHLAVEENEKMYKHEVVMRHRVEENLLGLEDTLKETKTLLETADAKSINFEKVAAAADEEKAKIAEDKENLISQISTLASTMAKDKQEIASLMSTLQTAQVDKTNALTGSADATEKANQMERVINQLIQDKAELENKNNALLEEKKRIMQDTNNVVELRARLEGELAKSEAALAASKELFEAEKKLKEEAGKCQKQAETTMAKHQEELTKLKESSISVIKERDDLKISLESVQKVLQGERQSKSELERLNQKNFEELGAIRKNFESEKKMKDDTVRSLEAESKSKVEAIRQLEEARKLGEKQTREFDKMKTDLDAAKEKSKDDERAKKDLQKLIDESKKETTKVSTEAEKNLRAKEELGRKLEVESGIAKDELKQLTSEKSDHEKTKKLLADEKAAKEKAERECESAKSGETEAKKAADSEKVEHAKTYKAYESEKSARAKLEADLAKAREEAAAATGDLKGAIAEKNAGDKRIEKLEAKIAALTEEKSEGSKSTAEAASLKRSLDQEQRARGELENKLFEERRRKAEAEAKVGEAKATVEEAKIKVQNLTLENKKLVSRIDRMELELGEERKIKNELVVAMKNVVAPGSKTF